MSGVRLTFRGFQKAFAAIAAVKGPTRGTIASKGLDVVGVAIIAGVKRAFVDARDPDTGRKWARLTSRKGQPLRDKGILMRSYAYRKVNQHAISVGSNHVGAMTHHMGDKNRVPATARMLRFVVFGKVVWAKKVVIPRRRAVPETEAGLKRLVPNLEATLKKWYEANWQ